MADVTLRYGANRKAEPLTEQERTGCAPWPGRAAGPHRNSTSWAA
jgi:hypothetical protein